MITTGLAPAQVAYAEASARLEISQEIRNEQLEAFFSHSSNDTGSDWKNARTELRIERASGYQDAMNNFRAAQKALFVWGRAIVDSPANGGQITGEMYDQMARSLSIATHWKLADVLMRWSGN